MAIDVATEIGCSCVPPDGGERIRIFNEEVVVKVAGAETGNAYALISMSVAPGGGPPLHAHPGSETAYVLSGEFEFTQRTDAGVATFRAGAGAVVHAPSGAAHRFENVGRERATMLQILSPELVTFLRELGAAFPPGAQPNLEAMLAINAKHGAELFYGDAGSRPEPSLDDAPSARARALAWRFAEANEALIATIEHCEADRWRAVCADTGWTVGVQAHHVAEGEATIAGLIGMAAEGQPAPPTPPALLDNFNGRHAEAFANVTRDETLTLLRRNGAAAAHTYRTLTDEQLQQTATFLAGGPAATVAALIERLAIGEIERHGEAIRDAIGA